MHVGITTYHFVYVYGYYLMRLVSTSTEIKDRPHIRRTTCYAAHRDKCNANCTL